MLGMTAEELGESGHFVALGALLEKSPDPADEMFSAFMSVVDEAVEMGLVPKSQRAKIAGIAKKAKAAGARGDKAGAEKLWKAAQAAADKAIEYALVSMSADMAESAAERVLEIRQALVEKKPPHGPPARDKRTQKVLSRYYDEIKKKQPGKSKEYYARVAWQRYCMYKNPDNPSCGPAGKSKDITTGPKAESLDDVFNAVLSSPSPLSEMRIRWKKLPPPPGKPFETTGYEADTPMGKAKVVKVKKGRRTIWVLRLNGKEVDLGRKADFDHAEGELLKMSESLHEAFADVYGVKGRWKKVKPADLKKNPELADEFFKLLSTAYKPIGGHAKIKSPAHLIGGEVSVITAIDIDSDPEADAVSFGKKKGPGVKSVGMGHDGSRPAKDKVLAYKGQQLKAGKQYAEMSGAIAHIMLTRYGVQSVDDEKTVEKILGKKVDWIGKHPDGKYPNNPGWYTRSIGGKDHMKILLGVPLKKRAKKESAMDLDDARADLIFERLSSKEKKEYNRARERGLNAKKSLEVAKKGGLSRPNTASKAARIHKSKQKDRANLRRLKSKAAKKGVDISAKSRKGKGRKMVFGKWVKTESDLDTIRADLLSEGQGTGKTREPDADLLSQFKADPRKAKAALKKRMGHAVGGDAILKHIAHAYDAGDVPNAVYSAAAALARVSDRADAAYAKRINQMASADAADMIVQAVKDTSYGSISNYEKWWKKKLAEEYDWIVEWVDLDVPVSEEHLTEKRGELAHVRGGPGFASEVGHSKHRAVKGPRDSTKAQKRAANRAVRRGKKKDIEKRMRGESVADELEMALAESVGGVPGGSDYHTGQFRPAPTNVVPASARGGGQDDSVPLADHYARLTKVKTGDQITVGPYAFSVKQAKHADDMTRLILVSGDGGLRDQFELSIPKPSAGLQDAKLIDMVGRERDFGLTQVKPPGGGTADDMRESYDERFGAILESERQMGVSPAADNDPVTVVTRALEPLVSKVRHYLDKKTGLHWKPQYAQPMPGKNLYVGNMVKLAYYSPVSPAVVRSYGGRPQVEIIVGTEPKLGRYRVQVRVQTKHGNNWSEKDMRVDPKGLKDPSKLLGWAMKMEW